MFFYIFLPLILILFFISLYFNYKLSKTILDIQDSVQKSVDLIDEKYKLIDEISKTDLASDSDEVKQVHNAIKDVKDSIHEVALILTENFNENDGEEDTKEEN